MEADLKAAIERKTTLALHRGSIHTLGWSSCGTYLASGSSDRSIVLSKIANGRLVKDQELKGHTNSVDQLCWRQDDTPVLLTASADKTCRIWDARASNKQVLSVNTDGENINICVHPDGTIFACGDKNDLVSIYDLRKGRRLAKKQYDCEINEIAWDRKGRHLYLTTGTGNVEIANHNENFKSAAEPLQAHTGNCVSIEFDRQNRHFASGSADALIAIFDAEELICVNTLSYLEFPIRRIGFSHDGSLLAASSEDSFLSISNVATCEVLHQLPTPNGTYALAFHPKSLALAYAPDEKVKEKEAYIEFIA